MSKSRSANLSFQEAFRKSAFSDKIALILSTWFGVGFVPFASGTFGTLAAIPFVLILSRFEMLDCVFTVLPVIIIGVWSADRTQDVLGMKDPSEVVIDEVAGFLLSLALVPDTWQAFFLCFFQFRLFDILKPFPIKKLEKLKGGFGIVMDDLLAGLYASAGTWLVLLILEFCQN